MVVTGDKKRHPWLGSIGDNSGQGARIALQGEMENKDNSFILKTWRLLELSLRLLLWMPPPPRVWDDGGSGAPLSRLAQGWCLVSGQTESPTDRWAASNGEKKGTLIQAFPPTKLPYTSEGLSLIQRGQVSCLLKVWYLLYIFFF